MPPNLENTLLSDGQRLLFVGVHHDRAGDRFAFRAVLFDGGVEERAVHWQGSVWSPDKGAVGELHALLSGVRELGWPLVVYGRGWRWGLESVCPSVSGLEPVPLRQAAAALAGVPATTGPAELLQALGAPGGTYTDALFSTIYEDLLWAVVHAASQAGLDWPGVQRLLQEADPRVAFDHYGFDDATLAGLPDAPGVYVMRDGCGKVLYVGKAASLQRRLRDYFRAQAALPAKLEQIRARIKTFNCYLTGSEMEALLLEHRLIGEMDPEINVQRTLVPGSGRYRPVAQPVAVAADSVSPRHRCVFVFGAREQCVQLRVLPDRPPNTYLTRLARFFLSRARTLPPHPRLENWGSDGNTICCRYWARHRHDLVWCALEGSPDSAARGICAAVRAHAVGTDPAEFRATRR